MNISNWIYRSLTTQISPMVYIMMAVSVIIGFCFLTDFGVSSTTSILYKTGTLVDVSLWGGLLFVAAGTALYGMVKKNTKCMKTGAASGFLLWCFATISFFLAGNFYAVVCFGLFHLLFMGYVYLATSFNLIFREPVGR